MGVLCLNSFWQKTSSKSITVFWVVIAVKLRKSPPIRTFTVEGHAKASNQQDVRSEDIC
jgi:hypothetical protein